MITADDIAGLVVLARTAAVTGYATTLPGASWYGRGPSNDPAGYPYDVFQIEPGPVKNSTGGGYTQVWTVRRAAYAPVGATGVDVNAVLKLYNDALVSTAAQTALRAIAMRNATEKVLRAKLVAGSPSQYARELRDGRDVFVAGQTVEILVQGDKDAT